VKWAASLEGREPIAGWFSKAQCGECTLNGRPAIPGEGPIPAQLALVSEAPGAVELAEGAPFRGPAGQLLDQVLLEADIRREDIYITNTCLCRPPKNATPTPAMIECCKPRLLAELRTVKPLVICVLGNVAARAILGTRSAMSKIRGQVFWSDTLQAYVIPTWRILVRHAPGICYPNLASRCSAPERG